VQEWPKALAMDSRAWEQSFKFPKFGNDDLVILHCRSNRRASWAAYLAQDAGLKRY
jgi:rhodanese-related sulfurtransferase